jgi:hypothetical protein
MSVEKCVLRCVPFNLESEAMEVLVASVLESRQKADNSLKHTRMGNRDPCCLMQQHNISFRQVIYMLLEFYW